VPEIRPADVIVKPFGKAPEVTAYVIGAGLLDVDASCNEYGTPNKASS
jgi:hypothetical protein